MTKYQQEIINLFYNTKIFWLGLQSQDGFRTFNLYNNIHTISLALKVETT